MIWPAVYNPSINFVSRDCFNCFESIASYSSGSKYPWYGLYDNVKKVVLSTFDIKDYFDCDYHHYVQGACCNEGKIYSLEGFTNSLDNPPAIRIIDTKLKKEITFKKFEEFGINIEPEMIDFYNGTCYYSDVAGNLYSIEF